MAALMRIVSVTASLISLLVLRPQRNREILLRTLREAADRLPDDSRVVYQQGITADPATRNGSSKEDTQEIDPPPRFPHKL